MANYPKFKLNSKRNFCKRVANKKVSAEKFQTLINTYKKHPEKYFYDHRKSDPENNKYVRAAYGPLRKLLNVLDQKILSVHDKLLPGYIYGGKTGSNVLQASKSLINKFKKRWFLKMDLKRFYEQVNRERIVSFFNKKCNCGLEFATFAADICTIPEGPKKSPGSKKLLARGFAPSTRLAAWCNLEFFLSLNKLIHKRLKGKDPKLVIWVDDIGISASNTSQEELENLKSEIIKLAEKHKLVFNLDPQKTRIYTESEPKYFLGTVIYSKTLGEPIEKKVKRKALIKMIDLEKDPQTKQKHLKKLAGMKNFKKQINQSNQNK